MADLYGDAGLAKYTQGGHTWLEIKNPTRITQTGKGGVNYAESFFVLPGSHTTAVSCYVDIYICVRVNENLDAQIKIVPGSYTGSYGSRGVWFDYVFPGSCRQMSDYMACMVLYKEYFTINSSSGTNRLDMKLSNGSTLVSGVQNAASNPSTGFVSLKKQTAQLGQDYGSTSFAPNGRLFHWQIGLGGNAGWDDLNSRYNGNWTGSAGWVTIGNLEKNFGWSSNKENFDGYIYLCGCGYYTDKWGTTQNVRAVPTKVTIPGLKRLMDYFPFEILKNGQWMSCNRSGGGLYSMKSGKWTDRKNRL